MDEKGVFHLHYVIYNHTKSDYRYVDVPIPAILGCYIYVNLFILRHVDATKKQVPLFMNENRGSVSRIVKSTRTFFEKRLQLSPIMYGLTPGHGYYNFSVECYITIRYIKDRLTPEALADVLYHDIETLYNYKELYNHINGHRQAADIIGYNVPKYDPDVVSDVQSMDPKLYEHIFMGMYQNGADSNKNIIPACS